MLPLWQIFFSLLVISKILISQFMFQAPWLVPLIIFAASRRWKHLTVTWQSFMRYFLFLPLIFVEQKQYRRELFSISWVGYIGVKHLKVSREHCSLRSTDQTIR